MLDFYTFFIFETLHISSSSWAICVVMERSTKKKKNLFKDKPEARRLVHGHIILSRARYLIETYFLLFFFSWKQSFTWSLLFVIATPQFINKKKINFCGAMHYSKQSNLFMHRIQFYKRLNLLMWTRAVVQFTLNTNLCDQQHFN